MPAPAMVAGRFWETGGGRVVESGAAGMNLEDSDHANHPALVPAAEQMARIAGIKATADLVLNARIDVHIRGGDTDAALIRAALEPHDVLLSIGGWGAGNFSEAALTDAARARFADTAVELVRRHDLDGLDIDWEYPAHPGPGISHRPEDKQNFTQLLTVLREKLDALSATNSGRRYLLTIAAADGEAAKGLEIAKIARILDWINLMTYDFYGSLTPTTGHHAALYRSRTAAPDSRNTQQAVDEFIKAGAPASKINIGLAFYGRTFGDVTVDHHGLHQRFGSDGGFISWQEIARDHLGKPGVVRYWDEQAQSAWLWNEKQRRLISYDDPQALQAKARFVRQRGLGGVMYWEHAQDPDEQLLDVVRTALHPAKP